jgi:serine/threonine-protein kinase ULK4
MEPVLRAFAKDLISALSYLHANGVIYCDLKPGNILLNEYSSLKLCDFGLSQKLVDMVNGEEQGGDNIDRQGTPYYMAPEMFDQGGVYSFSSDIYALGSVLYELASGKTPFTDENFTELVRSICESEPKMLVGVTEECSDFILKLLEKNPARRPKWPEIFRHKWLDGMIIEEYEYPEEPHFQKYIQSKGLDRIGVEGMKTLVESEAFIAPTISKLDLSSATKEEHILRLSLNVKKNITRETGEYLDFTDDHQDVKLDKNMTINLGKKVVGQTTTEITEEVTNKSHDNISQMEDSKSKISSMHKILRSHKSFE